MDNKEKRSGELTNKEIEQDRKVTEENKGYSYTGSQDNGDQTVRNLGTEVQRNDGFTTNENNEK